jgi:hypothetical protein
MENDNVDSAILSNMGNGLSTLIEQTPATAVTSEGLNPGIQLDFVGPELAGQVVPQGGNVAATPAVGLVTPQGGGQGMDPAEVQRLRDIAYQATQERIELDEQLFEAQLEAQGYTELEKQLLRTDRELKQTQQVNNWLNNQVQTVEQQREMNAKNQFGFLTAQQAGLPYDNPAVKAALMNAKNPQEMRQIATGLVNAFNQNQAQHVRGQANTGIFQTGSQANGTAVGPKPRSGDLAGYIAARPAQATNLWS